MELFSNGSQDRRLMSANVEQVDRAALQTELRSVHVDDPAGLPARAATQAARKPQACPGYAYVGPRTLPTFMAGGNAVPTSGRFVFFSEDGAELYVLVEAVSDQPLARRFGLVRMPTIE